MKFLIVVLGTSLLVQTSVAADSDDELGVFRSAVASQVAEEGYSEMDPNFLESGLAQQDFDRIVEELAEASADCVVNAMMTLAELKSIDVRLMIDDAENAVVNPEYFDTEGFDNIILPCFYAAAENAGMNIQ